MTGFVSDDPDTRDDFVHQSGVAAPQRSAIHHVAAQPLAVEWRSTATGLWIGRAGDRHMGTIEHGRDYAVTDADGRRRGSYRSLNAAMAATSAEDIDGDVRFVGESAGEFEVDVAPAWEGVALATAIIGAATVLLAAYGLTLL